MGVPALVGFKKKVKAETEIEVLQKNKAKCRRSSPGSPSHLAVFAWSWQGLIALPLPAKNPAKMTRSYLGYALTQRRFKQNSGFIIQ